MSRYRKVVSGELELPEVSGIKFLIYPTIEARIDLLDHIKATQIFDEYDERDSTGKIVGTKRVKGKYFELSGIAKTCTKLVYEGCFEHDINGKRTKKKEGEEETTEQQLLALILESDIMALYLEVLKALEIISKEKAEELKKGQVETEKN